MKVSEQRELRVLDRFAQNGLSDTQLMAWQSARVGHRFMAYIKKALVVYTIKGSIPTITQKLKCVSVGAEGDRGMSSVWMDELRGTTILVGHVPLEIAPGVFMGHTIYSSADYVEHQPEDYGLRFSMYVRTRQHPLYSKEAGVHYALEQNIYEEKFGTGV